MAGSSSESADAANAGNEDCLHCGEETTQLIGGKPYCSFSCIDARRRESELATLHCPYPECNWSCSWLPDNSLSKQAAYEDAEDHRSKHNGK